MPRRSRLASLLFMLALVAPPVFAGPPAVSVEPLIETDTTVLGMPFEYPEGTALIRSDIVTLPPGSVTPWHLHPVPLFGYVLQGTLIVDYGSEGERVYGPGDSLVEAFGWPHQGRNGGRGKVRILVVYAGADGVPNTVLADEQ